MIFTPENEYSAVLDASVLVPGVLCDTLLRLAEEPAMYRPVWSDDIMAEMARACATTLHRTAAEIHHRQTGMNYAFPEALVSVPLALPPALDCIPDAQHKPVLAAAILGRAHVIVTQNTKHFPQAGVRAYGVLCQSAEDFLIHQFRLCQQIVLNKLDDQAAGISQDRSYVIESLRRCVPGFAECIEEYLW